MGEFIKNVWIKFHTNEEDKASDTRVIVTVTEINNSISDHIDNDFGHFAVNSDTDWIKLNPVYHSLFLDYLLNGTITIRIDPKGNDTWRFNFTLVLELDDNSRYLYGVNGLELNQNNREKSFSLPNIIGDPLLTGVWNCDDGGKYYLRQIGSTLCWYGEENPSGPTWSNVAHGTINSNIINLEWVDVPKGNIMQSGILTLNIVSNNQLKATQKTGGFGGSVWSR